MVHIGTKSAIRVRRHVCNPALLRLGHLWCFRGYQLVRLLWVVIQQELSQEDSWVHGPAVAQGERDFIGTGRRRQGQMVPLFDEGGQTLHQDWHDCVV